MQNISNIIEKSKNGSNLILIDELGKNTTIFEGLAIAYSITTFFANLPKNVLFKKILKFRILLLLQVITINYQKYKNYIQIFESNLKYINNLNK